MDNIAKSYLYQFLINFQIFASITVPFIIEWGKLDFTRLFFLEMIFVATIAVFQIPTGAFADKYGRKTSVILGTFLSLLGLIFFIIQPNIWLFVLAEFFSGLGFVFVSGADDALIYDTLKLQNREKESKKVFSNKDIMTSLGVILGAPAGSIIASAMILPYPNNYLVPMALTAIPVFLGFLVSFSFQEVKHYKTPENRSLFHTSVRGLKDILHNRKTFALTLDWAIISALAFFMFWLYQPLLQESGVNVIYWGFVSAGFNIFAMILLRNIQWFDRRLGTKNLVFGSALAIGLGYILLTFTRNPFVILPIIFIVTAFNMVRAPVFRHLINEELPSERRATAMSVAAMFKDWSRFILYPIIGLITDVSLSLSFFFLGVIVLLVVIILHFMEKSKSNV